MSFDKSKLVTLEQLQALRDWVRAVEKETDQRVIAGKGE